MLARRMFAGVAVAFFAPAPGCGDQALSPCAACTDAAVTEDGVGSDYDAPDGDADHESDDATGQDASPDVQPDGDVGPWQRDWTAHPAIFTQVGAVRLWALSDVHGDRDRLLALLRGAGLIAPSGPALWTGGTDTLVVNGDNIDKGPQSLEVLELWMAVVPQAEASGGHVVVLLGNHEVEFLANPYNTKAVPLAVELGDVSPATFASPADPHGRFLRECPIAALVDGWFFSHAGNAGGRSQQEIATTFERLVDSDTWSDPFFLDDNSIVEARSWWPTAGTAAFLDGYLAALPAGHIVFGHNPTTFASAPTGSIEVRWGGRLLLIDVGMSSVVNYSAGKLLRVDGPGAPAESASMVDPAGTVVPLDLAGP